MMPSDGILAFDEQMAVQRANHIPESPLIDLTSDDPALPRLIGPSEEDADLAKALALSVESSGLAVTRFSAQDEDAEYTKAMEASLVSLQAEEVGNGWDVGPSFVRGEERVRDDMSSPPILRSLSHHLSGFSAYLQCLYAVPSWRNEVLAYRPVEADLARKRLYAGYWKGDLSSTYSAIECDAPIAQMWELQRLFAIMSETRRAFLHVEDVQRQLVVDEQAYKFNGSWIDELKGLHTTLVDAFTTYEGSRLAHLEAKNLLPAVDVHRAEAHRQASLFNICGRSIANDKFIGGPLPFHPPQPSDMASLFDIDIDPMRSPPDTIYSALDRTLVNSNDTSPTLSLFTNDPATLAIRIRRVPSGVSSLESFGRGTMRRKEVFRLPPEVWLDRYSVKKRDAISKGRAKIAVLEKERAFKVAARDRLAVTAGGEDALEVARKLIEYLKEATTDDPARAERQRRLSEQYPLVLSKMSEKIAEYDAGILALDGQIERVFDGPDMRKYGPYELRSILMWNGLNGRGSAWSVVKDDMGRWWRIKDLVKEEVTLEEALTDTSGVQLDAGAVMAFYQNSSLLPPRAEVPEFLRSAILQDNHSFASELPPALSESWNLPLLELLDLTAPEVHTITLLGESEPEDQVEDVVLESPREDVEDIPIDTDLRVDSQNLEDAAADAQVAMRLRGGATVEEEEEEGDCDSEGEDEDEVELGCLKAMSATWDVDLSVGKVGGVPRWIDPESPLRVEDVTCSACSSVMAFLLQMNSPDDEREHAASRALYIYVCRTKDCHERRVWRVQMSSPNKFYPHTPEAIALRKEIESRFDPKTGFEASSTTKQFPAFPEWEIVCEPEPYEESYLPEPVQGNIEGEMGPDDEAEPDTVSGVDGAFLRFQERVQRMPEQVLRFYRLPGIESPAPLWISSDQIESSSIPKCTLCGSSKDVEFQVLSTLLTYLEDYDLSLDSLLIYTCLEHCLIPSREGDKTGWAEETAVSQSYTSAGVTFGRE